MFDFSFNGLSGNVAILILGFVKLVKFVNQTNQHLSCYLTNFWTLIQIQQQNKLYLMSNKTAKCRQTKQIE